MTIEILRKPPTDAEQKAKALDRWVNEGGALPPADPFARGAGRVHATARREPALRNSARQAAAALSN